MPAPCNADALAWIAAWPDWPGPALALHGPAGSGKTHLLHIWRDTSGGTLLQGPDLDMDTAHALAGQPVAIDRADAMADPEPLFHLYNMQRDAGAHLLLAARTPPAHWTHGLPDLASRLATAPAVEIAEPDDTLLSALILKYAADRQLDLTESAFAYLLPRMVRSFAGVEETVRRLDRVALGQQRRRVSRDMVIAVLREME
ncbi:MAG: DnaA/Hda family protein [Minwuia sp.]|nr:DnaA/Hda family protein [Minwuia sp.]